MVSHDCHATISSLACDQVQYMNTHVATRGSGFTLNLNSVTIPKLPPPPPRSAQNRLGSLVFETWRMQPSGVMISAPTRVSSVSPIARPASHIPPPCVTPAIPPEALAPA